MPFSTNQHSLPSTPAISILVVLLSMLLLLPACSGSNPQSGQLAAPTDDRELIVRLVLEDGTMLGSHRAFFRIDPDITTARTREVLERDWQDDPSARVGIFRDADDNWWRAMGQTDRGPDVVHTYYVAHQLEGFSTEPLHQASANACDSCTYVIRVYRGDEEFPDTTTGLWESEPDRWAMASLRFERSEFEGLVQEAMESRSGSSVMLPVYTITLREAGADVSLALEPFASTPSYHYRDEQCAERLYEPVRGESTVPPGCVGRTGGAAE